MNIKFHENYFISGTDQNGCMNKPTSTESQRIQDLKDKDSFQKFQKYCMSVKLKKFENSITAKVSITEINIQFRYFDLEFSL